MWGLSELPRLAVVIGWLNEIVEGSCIGASFDWVCNPDVASGKVVWQQREDVSPAKHRSFGRKTDNAASRHDAGQ